jgi:hypothetical protein
MRYIILCLCLVSNEPNDIKQQLIDIVRVVCVGYDYDFVEDMASRLKTWVPKPSKTKNNKTDQKTIRKTTDKKGKPNGRKAKAKWVDSASDLDDYMDNVGSTSKRPLRSTRTRRLPMTAPTDDVDDDDVSVGSSSHSASDDASDSD